MVRDKDPGKIAWITTNENITSGWLKWQCFLFSSLSNYSELKHVLGLCIQLHRFVDHALNGVHKLSSMHSII